MTYSYFPGCTLKTRAKDLDHWGRESMKALGIELAELPEWQCCGAVYPIARDEIALRLSSVRALAAARDLNQPLVTLCSACHHVIKRVKSCGIDAAAFLCPQVGESCFSRFMVL